MQRKPPIARQLQDCPNAGVAFPSIGLCCEGFEFSLRRTPNGVGAQPGIVNVDRIDARGDGCPHSVQIHLMAVGGKISYHRLPCLVEGTYLLSSDARFDSSGCLAGVRSRIEFPHILPFAAKLNPLQHTFPLQDGQDLRPDPLGLDIQKQANIVLPSQPERVGEERNPHRLEALTHPSAGVKQLEFAIVGSIGLTHPVSKPLQESVMMQHNLPIQGAAQVNFDEVAPFECGLLQRFEGIFRNFLVSGPMAIQLDPPRLQRMSGNAGEGHGYWNQRQE